MSETTDSNQFANALKGPKPKLSLGGQSAEMRALEQTLALLNNPELSGAKMPAEEKTAQNQILRGPAGAAASVVEGPVDRHGATLPPGDLLLATPAAPVLVTPAPAPIPMPAIAPPKPAPVRILLTGKSGVGKSFLANQLSGYSLQELDAPIFELLADEHPEVIAAGMVTARKLFAPLAATIQAWGNGIINEKYPLSPARMMFRASLVSRGMWEGFGTPDFWVSILLRALPERVVLTRVETANEFRALMAAGFTHYHVVCSSATFSARNKRSGANDLLAAALDQDVTKKISNQRNGERLRCIWNDSAVPSPSNRLLTGPQWLQEMAIMEIPDTGE